MATKLVQSHVCDACLVAARRDIRRKPVADFGRTITIAGLGHVRFVCRECVERTAVRCDVFRRSA